MSKSRLRCAIYTRKSTDEGLDQSFNSLDAQREACIAYVASQKAEGWLALATCYDDGGYSGGNMERPALLDLLVDIAAERVNIVVVYNIDSLKKERHVDGWRPAAEIRCAGTGKPQSEG